MMTLELRAVTKKFTGLVAVNSVSFTARPGEVTGYLGPNGSGKSTTMKMITGLIEPSSGEIFFDGRPIRHDLLAFKRRLGYIPEEPYLYSHLSGLEFSGPRFAESIYANVTADDRFLFVSEEASASVTVIDLARARAGGYKEDAIVGDIPVGLAPIALPFSRDGKWLFNTSEAAPPAWQWPAACTAEGSNDAAIVRPEGALVVIDVEKAEVDPSSSVVARVPAGCSPVRAAMTPDGASLFVTARNSNAVLEFNTSKLVSDPANARVGSAPTGTAPVPVAVVNAGRMLVIAGNSNRFAAAGSESSRSFPTDQTGMM